MNKTGIVISISNKKAGIMTSSGEFVYIKANKTLPKIGEIHTGKLCSKNLLLYKYALAAASIMFIFISIISTYVYYTPITTIALGVNPSVSLEANRWNKIISSKALNSEGLLILDNIKLKYKDIDDGLELIVKEAKTENLLNGKKIIDIDIKSNKHSSIDISNFKKIIDNNNLSIKIIASSGNNKNIDITVNNKKIDILSLNNDYHKKFVPTKNSNINQKALENISTNTFDKKSINSSKTTINKYQKSDIKNYDNKSSTINKLFTSNRIKENVRDVENKSSGNIKLPYYDNKFEENSCKINPDVHINLKKNR